MSKHNKVRIYKTLLVIISAVSSIPLLLLIAAIGGQADIVTILIYAAIFAPFLAAAIVFGVLFNKANNDYDPWESLLGIGGSGDTDDISKKLRETYDGIGQADYGDPGFVTFVNEGLTFSAEGRYACKKDFKGIPGYHLAFRISGKALTSAPENYEDVIDYESVLFRIEIAYFEETPLTEDENENGIVVTDINNLEGKKLSFRQGRGYMCSIDTAETDEIDFGEIEFVEWNDHSRAIAFKCLVNTGVCDVIAGKLELTPEDVEASETGD